MTTIFPVKFKSNSAIGKLSTLADGAFSIELPSWAKIFVFSVTWNIMESAKSKRKVSDNSGHKIMKHFKIWVWFDSSQVVHEIYYKKHCIRVTSWNLRLSLRTKDLSKFGNGKNPKMVLVVKNCQKTDIKVSRSIQFCLDSWHCFINFICNCCHSKQGSKKYSVFQKVFCTII